MLNVNNYLRLALMFGENKATTFNKNLEKMVALVLFDKYSVGLTVAEIISDLKERYGLAFSDIEVIRAINHQRCKKIIQVNVTNCEADKQYSIVPDEYARISRKTDEKTIKEIAVDFLKKYTDVSFAEEEFSDLLVKYLYDVFNSNAETILSLMNGNKDTLQTVNYDYSVEEKESINKFLYWDNTEKNKWIYQLISCCFDYCMMTVRKDNNVYRTIFSNKKFYLDTNIIFRIMGLNNSNRKMIIDAFILKCKEVGIQIFYSNHTWNELNKTISYHVAQIKNTLTGSEPISVHAMAQLNDRLSNSRFYAEYVEWTKDSINSAGDYESFARDLKRKASEILSEFKQISFDDYAGCRSREYHEQFDSLKNYKIEHRRNVYDSSIKADVNNYLYIQDRNRENKGEDFFARNHYLITADHALAGWEKEKRPGTIPSVVLPSVWYSIILQYSGRATEDDYSSFVRFLNFSFPENEKADSRKIEILKLVLGLEGSTEIKEKTIYDISEKLRDEYKDLESDKIVEISYRCVTDQLIASERAKLETEKEEAVRAERERAEEHGKTQEAEYRASLKRMSNLHESEVNRLKAEKIRLEQSSEADIVKARKEEKNRLVEKETEKRTKKRLRLYWVITIVLAIGFVIALFITGRWVWGIEEATDETQLQYDYVKYIIDISYIALSTSIIGFVFKGLSKEKIRVIIREKVEKEFED